jgi:hypothetical protein
VLVLLILGLLVLGAVLGGAGMRRLGRWTNRAAGRWRPGVGVGAVLFAFAGLILSVRGGPVVGVPLLAVSGGLALLARRRGGKPAPPAPTMPKMSEADARAVLGVSPGATRKAIQDAYVRLMQRAHPDQGGTTGLAAQLNAARDRLVR